MFSLETATKEAARILALPEQREQVDIYLALASRGISVDEYFFRQRSVDKKMIMLGRKFGWKELKIFNMSTYKHERAHFEVWHRHNIKTKLYQLKSDVRIFYVMDVNFREIAIARKFTVDDVMDILKEMLAASYKGLRELTENHIADVLFYEVLNGLEVFDETNIMNRFSRYRWKAY